MIFLPIFGMVNFANLIVWDCYGLYNFIPMSNHPNLPWCRDLSYPLDHCFTVSQFNLNCPTEVTETGKLFLQLFLIPYESLK